MADNGADHERFMRIAIDEARKSGAAGNRAVGAVIALDGEVLATGGNQRESAVDALGHAETTALRNAVAKTGSLDFSGCTLYTTLEPCPMCCGAIAVNNIELVVVGAMHTEGNRRWGDYTVEKVTEMIGVGTEIISPVLEGECNAVLHEYDVKLGRA
jgi:tRNA(adenine34) deaminase